MILIKYFETINNHVVIQNKILPCECEIQIAGGEIAHVIFVVEKYI